MEKINLLLLVMFQFIVVLHYGMSVPFPDPEVEESVYGAPYKNNAMENLIEKAPVAAPQKAGPPHPIAASVYTKREEEQFRQQKEQLKQLKVKLLEQEEIAKQKLLVVAKAEVVPKPQPQPLPQAPYQPAAIQQIVPESQTSKPSVYAQETNTPYLATPTFSNHLDDYPPKDGQDPLTGVYHNTPNTNTPQLYQPFHPGHYRGYPYMYGYPLDMRHGYAYGHAFATDDNFKCPANGRYYRDFGSFYSCEGGTFTVQFCAPGSRNSLPSYHEKDNEVHPFCNVNIVGSHFPMLIPH